MRTPTLHLQLPILSFVNFFFLDREDILIYREHLSREWLTGEVGRQLWKSTRLPIALLKAGSAVAGCQGLTPVTL